MQKIHQIQIRFVPAEDRLMFRVRTTDQREFRLWFTRRYVKLLWKGLQQVLAETQSVISPDPQTRQAVLSFQHEQAVAKMDFSTPYQQGSEAQRPLGDEPVLLTNIQMRPGPGKNQILRLHPEQGPGVELALDATWLHSFCKLLADAVRKADWDLTLQIAVHVEPISTTAH
ncbi:MAG: hypothetical protein JXL84_00330 [Deltaproteobacteria bacterium]|nr:hypothetical protein [Deltaproteobacteria bacterium]